MDKVENLNTDTRLCSKDETIQIFEHKILSIHNLPSIEDTVHYLHAALGFPTKETVVNAIRKGFLTSLPGLTVQAVNKYFPELVETQKSHMRHQRKGL
jgi:hypothetical protein